MLTPKLRRAVADRSEDTSVALVGPCAAEVTARGYINVVSHAHDRAAVEDAASRGGVNAAIAVTKRGVLSKAQCRFMVPVFAHGDEVESLIEWERNTMLPNDQAHRKTGSGESHD